METVKLGKELRGKATKGRMYNMITENSLLSLLVPSPFLRLLKGLSPVDPDPIPPILAQTVIHAVESISFLLISALTLGNTSMHIYVYEHKDTH
jgi:hypothetical protein